LREFKARPKMVAILTPKKKLPPEVEREFNEHYNQVHLPLMIKVPGIVEIRRYKAVEGTYGGTPMEGGMYIAEYDIESEEVIEKTLNSPERLAALKDERLMNLINEYFNLVRSVYIPVYSIKEERG
jgi:uncharacterized protein (TIGR02118 family)